MHGPHSLMNLKLHNKYAEIHHCVWKWNMYLCDPPESIHLSCLPCPYLLPPQTNLFLGTEVIWVNKHHLSEHLHNSYKLLNLE